MTRNLLALAVGCALAGATARAQLRSDLIESARAEKEAHLTPETPPKAERRLVWAENTLVYRLLTGDANGFGVSFGEIAPESGFRSVRHTAATTFGPDVSRLVWRRG